MYDTLSNDYDIPITASSSSANHDYDIPQRSGKMMKQKESSAVASEKLLFLNSNYRQQINICRMKKI
jgi:hypothetical protein